MSALKGKKIILGITGSIAAYKSALLTRLLVKIGADVKVIMTEQATQFVSSLTLSTLSKNEVHTQIFGENGWHNHVELGLWADYIIVAPATANTIAKMANGICDNMITAVYLSSKCPTIIAPAMDLDMWKHPSTLRNLETITKDNVSIIPVGNGELASGLIGEGRMAEPEEIIAYLENKINSVPKPLSGKTVLITAGPTFESIDPVRFIGNRSSGKMGIEIADYAASLGANVLIVLGPTHLRPHNNEVKVIPVESGDEMYDSALKLFESTDIAILAAAVADYKPVNIAKEKIKKNDDTLDIQLIKNKDIAAAIGQLKKPNQFTVGFALETNDEVDNAIKKIHKKNFDFIVLNSLKDTGAGFGGDTNKITIINNTNEIQQFELKSKTEVAQDIVNEIVKNLNK